MLSVPIELLKFYVMKHIFINVMLLAFCCAGVLPAVGQNVNVSVSLSQTKQEVLGFGGGIVYYNNWFAAHKNKEAIYDTVFTGLGLSALRMGNWAQDTSVSVSDVADIYAAAKKRLGSEFFMEMSSWTAPVELKANGKLEGTNGGVTASLKKEYGRFVYDKFGKWWRESLELYHSHGVYPDYISIQNEPDMDAPDYAAMVLNPDESYDVASYGEALKAVASAIDGMEHEPKIVGPEVLGIGWNQAQKYVEKLDKKLLDAYSFHYYHSGKNDHENELRYAHPDDYIDAFKGMAVDFADKPQIMTENSALREREKYDEVYMAWIMANGFNYNGIASYIHWNLLWGNTGGGCVNVEEPWADSTWTTKDGFIVQSEYHALRHYSKFVRPGWLFVKSASSNADVVSVAFRNKAGDSLSVILVNKGKVAHNCALSGFEEFSGNVIQTAADKNVWSKVVGKYEVGDVFSLPAMSITTVALHPAMVIPDVEWEAPLLDDVCLSGETKALNWILSDTFPMKASLYWKAVLKVVGAEASSEWENEDGTFGWYVDNLLDVNNTSRWAAQSSGNEWVELKLDTFAAVSGVFIDEETTEYGVIDSFELQCFINDEWVTVHEGVSIGSDFQVDFDPVNTNRVRLFVKTAGSININYFTVKGAGGKITDLSVDQENYDWLIGDEVSGRVALEILLADGTSVSESEPFDVKKETSCLNNGKTVQERVCVEDDRVVFYSSCNQMLSLSVCDELGKVVFNGSVSLSQGRNVLDIKLPNGVWVVNFGKRSCKILK